MKTAWTWVQQGEQAFLFLGDQNEVDAEVKSLIERLTPDGNGLMFKDGTRVFVTTDPITKPGKGSEIYTWDKSGNRVRCNITRTIITPDAKVTKEVLRTVYKNFDKLYA